VRQGLWLATMLAVPAVLAAMERRPDSGRARDRRQVVISVPHDISSAIAPGFVFALWLIVLRAFMEGLGDRGR
jgi:hypothetical protein